MPQLQAEEHPAWQGIIRAMRIIQTEKEYWLTEKMELGQEIHHPIMPAIVLPIQTLEAIVAQVNLIIQVTTEQLAMTLTTDH